MCVNVNCYSNVTRQKQKQTIRKNYVRRRERGKAVKLQIALATYTLTLLRGNKYFPSGSRQILITVFPAYTISSRKIRSLAIPPSPGFRWASAASSSTSFRLIGLIMLPARVGSATEALYYAVWFRKVRTAVCSRAIKYPTPGVWAARVESSIMGWVPAIWWWDLEVDDDQACKKLRIKCSSNRMCTSECETDCYPLKLMTTGSTHPKLRWYSSKWFYHYRWM